MQDVQQRLFLTIQDSMLAPPEMPTTYVNNSEWSKLCKVDEKLLASYKKMQSSEHKENNYDQHAKKKQNVLDNVSILLSNKNSTDNTTLCMNCNPPQWDKSGESY
jgi:hypothetical protein